jgi:alpha-tubulin suppressor-like RCC1 family protein
MKGYGLSILLLIGCGPAGPPIYVDIAVGRGHLCTLDEKGSIHCFGKHVYNQVHHPPEGEFTALAAGGQHSCALDLNGEISCWGHPDGNEGAPSGSYAQIEAGVGFTCALDDAGEGTCWGDSADNALEIPSGAFQEIALGEQHGCGLRDDGAVACWGRNHEGQSTDPEGAFTQIGAAYAHSCGLTTDGDVSCWGRGTWLDEAPTGVDNATDLLSGGTFDCVWNEDDRLWCWGDVFEWSYSDDTPVREDPDGPYFAVDADHARLCGAHKDGGFDCFGARLWRQ